ncbi:hypothetical protein BGZ58_005866, partial [Dissophora ornata]
VDSVCDPGSCTLQSVGGPSKQTDTSIVFTLGHLLYGDKVILTASYKFHRRTRALGKTGNGPKELSSERLTKTTCVSIHSTESSVVARYDHWHQRESINRM